MSRKPSTPGTCVICQADLKKTSADKHLASCLAQASGRTDYVIVRAEGYGFGGNDYWLYAAVPAECTLKDLDRFLRKTWLECCGHMSAFRNSPMSVRVGQFEPGDKLLHEYDFGDTTELMVIFGEKVRAAKLSGRDKIKVIARNLPFENKCECGKQATYICPMCSCEGDGWLCPDCAGEHECGTPDDVLLPVTNSPRCGVCGYEG